MNHYIDIKLLPDAEIPVSVLMNATYIKLHKALFDLNSTNIGVSFPKYKITLGDALRIHGDESVLKDLQGFDWLGGMKGYCEIGDIAAAPIDAKHRTVSRLHVKDTSAKLRRLIKRGNTTEAAIQSYDAKIGSAEFKNRPYLELQSASNGNKHRRYIAFGELFDKPVKGEFDQFGLSKTATVPWF